MDKKDILKACRIEGNILYLPDFQMDRKLYISVAKDLELIGGKWKSGKVKGFVFDSNPQTLLDTLLNETSTNIKKEYQFFPTPNDIADYLVELAELKEGESILEPSAGQGAIINAIQRTGNHLVYCMELMSTNKEILLDKVSNIKFLADDFLTYDGAKFDKIIANPPFSKNQDIEHVKKMYEILNDGGTLISVMSTHWQYSNNKKETAFREWLDKVGGVQYNIEAGRFKESGTMIQSCIVKITK